MFNIKSLYPIDQKLLKNRGVQALSHVLLEPYRRTSSRVRASCSRRIQDPRSRRRIRGVTDRSRAPQSSPRPSSLPASPLDPTQASLERRAPARCPASRADLRSRPPPPPPTERDSGSKSSKEKRASGDECDRVRDYSESDPHSYHSADVFVVVSEVRVVWR